MTMKPPTPPIRHREKAALIVAIVVAIVVVMFFALRVFWHSEVQERDPDSLNAPDMPNDAPVSALLEIE